ncbi:hypothetical protein D3C80_2088800 [compost metagenome]
MVAKGGQGTLKDLDLRAFRVDLHQLAAFEPKFVDSQAGDLNEIARFTFGERERGDASEVEVGGVVDPRNG